MARINLTLDQDEVLGLLTKGGGGDAFKLLLQETLNGVLREKSAEQLCAQPYEQTQERTDSHNETKARSLTTRVATIELKVSRQRNAPFETLVTEVIVAGVFTVKVGRVIEEVCERSFSKQSLFEACAELDCAVRASCDWPLKGE
jgi:putative transposase